MLDNFKLKNWRPETLPLEQVHPSMNMMYQEQKDKLKSKINKEYHYSCLMMRFLSKIKRKKDTQYNYSCIVKIKGPTII